MGKGSKPVVGYWYRVAYHHGLTIGPIDAFLEYRGGDKTAWRGELTSSGTISINAPYLWGGEKDQGGIVGDVDVMFGEPTQMPNEYLVSAFGAQTTAWRGFTTIAFKGGRYGAMNPYPQRPSYKFRQILNGWDGECWYPEAAVIPFGMTETPTPGVWPWKVRSGSTFVIGASEEYAGTFLSFNGWWHGNIDSFRITKGVCRYPVTGYDVPEDGFGDAVSDPNYANVVLLLRMEGSDGSTTFTDDKGHSVTAYSGAQISTARAKFGSSSGYFNGLNSYLLASMGADQDLGAAWTIDAWVWLESERETSPDTYGRAIFGYGALNVGYQDTAWFCNGDRWNYCQREGPIPEGNQPYLVQNMGPRAQVGRWAFVSVCYDGTNYWMHQDGQLLTGTATKSSGINPAHLLYYSRTNSEMGREFPASINEASLMAAADALEAEGFGICPKWDPASESVADFEQRICKLIGGSFSRSLEDGQWYLDLARGDYVLDDLPILTDDDILDFKEQPSILDNAINSVSVRYFDPEKKETIVTPPVRALGLVAAFGTIHQTNDYPEIPTADLAARIALRDLLATSTPTRAFDLVTNRVPYNWRPNQYFRLQAPKRGIADMVCILGEPQTGNLKSGAIRIKAAQDIYALPSTSFVQVEPGVDTRPPQTPTAITLQRTFEAPYIEVAGELSRADLAALPADVGYAVAAAATATGDIDFSMMVEPAGGEFVDVARGDWCATAMVVEPAGPSDLDFTITNGSRLASVEIGQAALWEDEIVRVDAIDADIGTLTLGRGCADTVSALEHAAGSRIFFYEVGAARATTEYTDGESIDVKLLSNTGSQQLPLSSASGIGITFAARQSRPYPPGQFRINGSADPESIVGAVAVTGVHRDRLQQADQLVDSEMAGVGPEAGTTYTVRYYINGTLAHTDSGLSTPSSSYSPTAGGIMRVEMESVRDGLTSYQMHVREFAVGSPLQDESGALITTEDDQPILMG